MDLLTKYIVALTNLQGIINKVQVMGAYNVQNEEKIKLSDVEKILEDPPKELTNNSIKVHQDNFVYETILDDDKFDMLWEAKWHKPIYIPKKDELLLYTSYEYFEKTEQSEALLAYMKKHFFADNELKAELLIMDVHTMCRHEYNVQMIIDEIKEWDVQFKDVKQEREVTKLVKELKNHVRTWGNNGHTPQEVSDISDNMRRKHHTDSHLGAYETSVVNKIMGNKIGRNDPCYCGSGKKYKKCCMNE